MKTLFEVIIIYLNNKVVLCEIIDNAVLHILGINKITNITNQLQIQKYKY